MFISKLTVILALLFVLLGIALVVRAVRADRRDAPRYARAAAGAFVTAAGNLLLFRSPAIGLVLFLIGVWLIFSLGRR